MPIAIITAKGQVAIPKAIREHFGPSEGDKLEFSIDDAGRIVARPQHCDNICGILRDFPPEIPVTVDAMNEAVRRRVAETVSGGA